jgi:hypothetical protein
VAGALAGWMITKGLELALLESDPRAEVPPCFEVGAPFHHRFRPNCVGEMKTPRGLKRISVNEDGLRELPRSQVLEAGRGVLVMGDSFVEGWWASQDEALNSRLAEKFPGTYFINGGLRSTGPVMQAEKLRALLPRYRPRGVIWLVNDTDSLDDRFTCAIAEKPGPGAALGAPEFELSAWQKTAASLLGDSSAGHRLRLHYYQQKWRELATSSSAGLCDSCRGIKEFKRVADAAGLPVLAFYLHSREGLPMAHYEAGSDLRAELKTCMEKAGVAVRPAGLLGMPEQDIKRYVWEGDFHLNPEGTVMLAEQISPAVEHWLKEIGGKLGNRGAK